LQPPRSDAALQRCAFNELRKGIGRSEGVIVTAAVRREELQRDVQRSMADRYCIEQF
jgi:hypothetical protein